MRGEERRSEMIRGCPELRPVEEGKRLGVEGKRKGKYKDRKRV